MRILKKKIHYNKGTGFLQLVPTEEDDYWHLYNLVQVGDVIKTTTQRKIIRETITGSKVSERKRISVLLKVTEINYWAEQSLHLTIKGKNCRESPFLSLGQYHTLTLEFNVPIVIYKQHWDKFHYKIIDECSQTSDSSDVGALIMEEGVAHLCYITNSTTLLKQKIQKSISKKRSGSEQRKKTMNDFFGLILSSIDSEQMLDKVKCLIIASPGFIKDDFMKFVKQEVQKETYRHLAKNVDKIVLAKSSSGYLNSLLEVLQDPGIQGQLSNTKALGEVKLLDQFFTQLKTDSERVAYGLKDVLFAHSQNAIQTLLLTDQLARTRDLKKRQNYIQLMEEVKQRGGEVHIFSSLHPTGQQLNEFSGIAAILFFGVQFNYEDESEQSEEEINEEEPVASKLDESLLQDFDEFNEDQFM